MNILKKINLTKRGGTILTALATATLISAQNVNIPDANFKAYLIGEAAINTNGDTEIQISEANAFAGNINCPGLSISDLTGIEAFTSINYLYCFGNQLTNLNLTNNTNLLGLRCYSNQLNSLDLSRNTSLTELFCNDNNLTSLDLLNNTAITKLRCQTNQITSLDLSNLTGLINVVCGYNNLASLNIANGNNTSITLFSASSNPNLTCIQVDDVSYSNANWTFIDSQTNFSLSCGSSSVLVSSIAVQGQNGVSEINIPGGALQMEASVLPANATDGSYTWSVTNNGGSASINANGVLTAMTNGNVNVTATANDGSGVVGSKSIIISNQGVDIEEVSLHLVNIYPNPCENQLTIASKSPIKKIELYTMTGEKVAQYKNEIVNLNRFQSGIYFVKVFLENGCFVKQIIKK